MNRKIMAIALATVAAAALVGMAADGQTVRAAAIVTDVQVPAKVDNFRLVDQNSKAQELYYFKNARAVVIITQANGATHVKDAAPAIRALKDKYAAQDVAFLMLNSLPGDQPGAIAAEMKKIGLDLPVMTDPTQLVGESLGVSRVAQAFVIQPKTWSVVYSGPIDDRFAGRTAQAGRGSEKSLCGERHRQPGRRQGGCRRRSQTRKRSHSFPATRPQGRVCKNLLRYAGRSDPREELRRLSL